MSNDSESCRDDVKWTRDQEIHNQRYDSAIITIYVDITIHIEASGSFS